MDEDQASAKAGIVLNLESMIKSHIASVERLEVEMDKFKAMLDDILENDPTYKEHSEKAKEASKVKAQTKRQILKQPQAADLSNKITTLKSQIKETNSALSDYLQEFQRLSGLSEIEGSDGEVREIVYTAKLRPKSRV